VGIVPLVMIYIVILTAAQLNLVIRVITTESIDKASVVNSREESFFRWHGCSDSKLSVLVLDVRVSSSVGPQHKPAVALVYIQN
jgi:hypothetical protein